MPPAPWQVQLEAPFKCALCKKIVTLRGYEAWMIHVYADLKAYVCIHPSCNQSFEYFHLWAEHVLTSHFPEVKRYCVYCNAEITSTPEISTRNAFVEHLVHNHWHSLSDAERTAATMNTERFVVATFTSFPCGICRRAKWRTWYEFVAHMARHLEEISLAALSEDMYSLDENPAMRNEILPSVTRDHRSKKRDAPRERTNTLELSFHHHHRRQHRHHENREETDLSQGEPDYIRIDHEIPSISVKKPHRDSLRPRKVREKAKERNPDPEEQNQEEGEPASSIHVTFEDNDPHRHNRRHSPLTKGKNPIQDLIINNIKTNNNSMNSPIKEGKVSRCMDTQQQQQQQQQYTRMRVGMG
ncbi:hypothetical protein TSTA_014340 [Talaromyces stipitatus ATCC 10500]|uniref:C2H2-type domain-containing protein n=1 Tax=Talaromyces stipitatus (strain ATCC 10500 / CBS 375.48 / QM 6759 / NRRL 1006) TaxID=441959 RepID=B8MGW2_TALSN|nr:uncharacterized protein TSTA_014340 [Talaromyces stipitatus ATCC 10500]EED16343.1 hypothetical protein TSTA_014340 [Talaromyces stipitatus ATCC 10500]